ncbi:hypothetical protein D9M70_435890 [compost metagenome]
MAARRSSAACFNCELNALSRREFFSSSCSCSNTRRSRSARFSAVAPSTNRVTSAPIWLELADTLRFTAASVSKKLNFPKLSWMLTVLSSVLAYQFECRARSRAASVVEDSSSVTPANSRLMDVPVSTAEDRRFFPQYANSIASRRDVLPTPLLPTMRLTRPSGCSFCSG